MFQAGYQSEYDDLVVEEIYSWMDSCYGIGHRRSLNVRLINDRARGGVGEKLWKARAFVPEPQRQHLVS